MVDTSPGHKPPPSQHSGMPPRSAMSSFSVTTDPGNEVVCPLKNQDGSHCRKRCTGEKRYRSMQEHIRRAHPEHYISKLPATEESFLLMINSPPSDQRARAQQYPPPELRHTPHSFPHDRYHREIASGPVTPRTSDEFGPGAVMHPAATALAQLHSFKAESDWDSEGDLYSDNDRQIPRSSIELPPILPGDPSQRQRNEILPSLLAGSPPGRSSTLPPLQRSLGPGRPGKPSVSKRGREAYHKKERSRGSGADIFRRFNDERLRPGHHDRKALSAEPSANYGKRWEDLIDAADQAASAAGDLNGERTPVPQSPVSNYRASLPPFPQHFQTPAHYHASPLQQALTPPSYNQEAAEPFPSVESNESGENFHMESRGLSDSSPSFSAQTIQIYCAACQGISLLRESFACTECICGLCHACVEVLLSEQGARRQCPRCSTIGGRFKPFQLDIR